MCGIINITVSYNPLTVSDIMYYIVSVYGILVRLTYPIVE